MVLAGRSFALAVVTLAAGGAVGAVGFRPGLFVFIPGFWAAWFGAGSEGGWLLAFLGVNAGVWWAAWAAALGFIRWLPEDRRCGEPDPVIAMQPEAESTGPRG